MGPRASACSRFAGRSAGKLCAAYPAILPLGDPLRVGASANDGVPGGPTKFHLPRAPILDEI